MVVASAPILGAVLAASSSCASRQNGDVARAEADDQASAEPDASAIALGPYPYKSFSFADAADLDAATDVASSPPKVEASPQELWRRMTAHCTKKGGFYALVTAQGETARLEAGCPDPPWPMPVPSMVHVMGVVQDHMGIGHGIGVMHLRACEGAQKLYIQVSASKFSLSPGDVNQYGEIHYRRHGAEYSGTTNSKIVLTRLTDKMVEGTFTGTVFSFGVRSSAKLDVSGRFRVCRVGDDPRDGGA